MADFAITISNTLNVFGAAPVNQWGTAELGTDNWGSSEDLVLSFAKIITNDISLSDTTSIEATFRITVSNSMVATSDVTELEKLDEAGYSYLFSGSTIDGDAQIVTSYTKAGEGSDAFSLQTTTATDWTKI
jgi:hypothetical protein